MVHQETPLHPVAGENRARIILFYGHPGVPVQNRARLETADGRLPIDVRGDGGYVIAPPSVHASGAVTSSPAIGPSHARTPAALAWLAATPHAHVCTATGVRRGHSVI